VYLIDDGQGRFNLYIDGVLVCYSKTVEMAFVVMMTAYYVFDIVMCKTNIKTMVFLRKFGCHIEEHTKDVRINNAHKQCVGLMEKLTLKQATVRSGKKARLPNVHLDVTDSSGHSSSADGGRTDCALDVEATLEQNSTVTTEGTSVEDNDGGNAIPGKTHSSEKKKSKKHTGFAVRAGKSKGAEREENEGKGRGAAGKKREWKGRNKVHEDNVEEKDKSDRGDSLNVKRKKSSAALGDFYFYK